MVLMSMLAPIGGTSIHILSQKAKILQLLYFPSITTFLFMCDKSFIVLILLYTFINVTF